jgi:hypothetical protein
MLDLNTITAEDLKNEILLSDDLNDFYNTLNEDKFLNDEYSREELVTLLEDWLTVNADNL